LTGILFYSDLYSNWGLTDHELTTIPPSLVRGFESTGWTGSFGSELPYNFGRKLIRGEKNAELYGPLQDEYLQGEKDGTDIWIHKNRYVYIKRFVSSE
jgi:hypothetical protein